MKIRLRKSKHYKFGLYLAKGEVREAIILQDGTAKVEANGKGSNVWLTLGKKDFEIID